MSEGNLCKDPNGGDQKPGNEDSDVSTMKSMAVKRRESCARLVVNLWDAIACIRRKKQIPNFENLSKYMYFAYCLDAPVIERQLIFAVNEGLIKVGTEQDEYCVPEEIQERDGHDWYCFECHRGKEVILCTTCHRVYHEGCLRGSVETANFVCPVCEQQNTDRFILNLEKMELNNLLRYTMQRLKRKTEELNQIPDEEEEKHRSSFFIYEPMDFAAMENKIESNEYSKLGEFYTDVQQIVHNVAVYIGINSAVSEISKAILADVEFELNDIIQCPNCYKLNNLEDGFIQPCDPPHELVYAKLTSYPYWPAKVIKRENNKVDVRFFEPEHQRAQVPEKSVKPITTNMKDLNVKQTSKFKQAVKELKQHQDLIEAYRQGRS